MTISRRKLIEPQITPFYHVINRCVRRAYLCGDDPYNGKNYQHRRGWIVNKITNKQWTAIFLHINRRKLQPNYKRIIRTAITLHINHE